MFMWFIVSQTFTNGSKVEVCYLMTLLLSRAYSSNDSMINEYGADGGMKMGGKTEALGETCPNATLSTTNPT
jgi:hypothetical protein